MTAKRFSQALGNVRESYVNEAATYTEKKKTKNWLRWGGVAACLCLAVVGAIMIPMLNRGEIFNDDPPHYSEYPYNDRDALDYVGRSIDDIRTDLGTVTFNEITDIEAYRRFNTRYTQDNRPYYSTGTTAFDLLTEYPISGQNDFIGVSIFEKNGRVENCPNYDEFLLFKDKAPVAAELVMQIFEKGDATHAYAYYNHVIDSYGISFCPESNCDAGVVIGKDISAIDDRFKNILPILQCTLGTENSTYIGDQEISVHYFYQNRLFRDSKTEEAYRYYVYFERNGLQYLYQFSSNWSLMGRNVSAIHNPPHTLHYVASQEECLELFVDYLLTLVKTVD